MDYDYFKFLKAIGVTTVALSVFNIHSDIINRDIIETPDTKLEVEDICGMVTQLGMNLRLCINVTDCLVNADIDPFYAGMKYPDVVDKILDRCADLGASQVTFRKMWSVEGTPEAEWIKANSRLSDTVLETVASQVRNKGVLLGKLPYGAERYDYKGFSIVIDTDSMAKDESNQETKYYIIRENGKMYSAWDSPASIVF